MQVMINGAMQEIEKTVLSDVLRELGFGTQAVAVELNGEILSMDSYISTVITAADRLEIVTFVGGG
ncbi:sulfur carrier protein ThiS [Veillonella agrestimuris]|uniref:sulfur carrier protein ThiS n=1 Tax=Veillonella agrestimuris TaxID=2941340 RepID=UPI00203AD58B|nr:sulfur carrier protein ThiS [Veillonella agrestimuris]